MGLSDWQLPGLVPGAGPHGENSDVDREGFRIASTDPNALANNTRIRQQRNAVDSRANFSMTSSQQARANTMDMTQSNQTAGQQDALVQDLTRRAQGLGGPSAAQQQLMANTQASLRAQDALAKTGTVQGNAGARAAAWNKAGIAARGTQDAQQLGQQEQWQAQDQLQSVLGGMADQELGEQNFDSQMSQTQQIRNASAAQQAALANQNAALSGRAENNAMDRFLLGQQLGMSSNQFQLQQQAEQSYQNHLLSEAGLQNGITIQNAENQMQALGAGFNAVGSGVAGLAKYANSGNSAGYNASAPPMQVNSPAQWDQYSSDRRLKKNVRKEPQKFMDELHPYEFEYKDKSKGEGTWLGIMAQDAMKSKMGRSLVSKDDDGFMQLDVKKTLSAALAGLANLNERLDKIEKKKT